MPAITATAIQRVIAAHDPSLPVTVAQTGGGCATIYVGLPDADDRYPLVIGPGSYDWGDSSLSIFALGDLYVGPDDDGESEPATIVRLADLAAYLG